MLHVFNDCAFPQLLDLSVVPVVHALLDLLSTDEVILVLVVAVVHDVIATENTFKLLLVADDQRTHVLVDLSECGDRLTVQREQVSIVALRFVYVGLELTSGKVKHLQHRLLLKIFLTPLHVILGDSVKFVFLSFEIVFFQESGNVHFDPQTRCQIRTILDQDNPTVYID